MGVQRVKESIARLRDLASRIPRPGCDWEERPRFGAPATMDEVEAIERAAGFPLPVDLRAFLSETSGIVGMAVHNGYWIGDIESIDHADSRSHVENNRVIPIATDGGGNSFLMDATGQVWKCDRETGELSQIARSFADFLDRVLADWVAYVANTPGWRFMT